MLRIRVHTLILLLAAAVALTAGLRRQWGRRFRRGDRSDPPADLGRRKRHCGLLSGRNLDAAA